MISHSFFEWAVVGAGPAGIAAVGKLLDHGINAKNILWIDPEFKVGDFGTKWLKVSSNTKVKLFTDFYYACHAFHYQSSPSSHEIKYLDSESTCLLSLAVEPLQWITNHLKAYVQSKEGKVLNIKPLNQCWSLILNTGAVLSSNVILATGSEPRSLSLPFIEEICLHTALDPEKLKQACDIEDTIAVFGSSHSAIIIIKTLLEQCDVKKIINFYLRPLCYAIYYDNWTLNDDTGLKGQTAKWAREHIDGKIPKKLERFISNSENMKMILPLCTKAIYAIGFEKRVISVEGLTTLEHNFLTGKIAPKLYGLGIAFPEAKLNIHGTLEHRVGLWKFMDYLNHIIPTWLNDSHYCPTKKNKKS